MGWAPQCGPCVDSRDVSFERGCSDAWKTRATPDIQIYKAAVRFSERRGRKTGVARGVRHSPGVAGEAWVCECSSKPQDPPGPSCGGAQVLLAMLAATAAAAHTIIYSVDVATSTRKENVFGHLHLAEKTLLAARCCVEDQCARQAGKTFAAGSTCSVPLRAAAAGGGEIGDGERPSLGPGVRTGF
ncbi:hypothetical protein E2C01_068656 [Portunus trituberculatus]|uniref:Uncharacterized protein n=1 Tax=Portunus trituberculatus TaxID=210409 RepID=A0A5B7HX02_PORTR|nr:hypothetical protein [Portunus trituberculatus]